MNVPNGLILEDRGVLSLSGDDVRPFLQGLITNDVDKLSPGNPLYGALLTPQGKFLFDFFVIENEDHILLDCQGDRRDALIKRLKMYRLRSAVTLDDVTDDNAVGVIWGGDIPDTSGCIAYSDPRHSSLGTRLIGRPEAVKKALAGCNEASSEDWTTHRIGLGIPESGIDILPEDTFWLESNAEDLNGVDFKKGCYVGQEVTSRMKHKSSLKKRLIPLDFGDHPATGGHPVLAGEKKAGDVRSTVGNQGIAMLRLDRVTDGGGTITVDGKPATLAPPDWMELTE